MLDSFLAFLGFITVVLFVKDVIICGKEVVDTAKPGSKKADKDIVIRVDYGKGGGNG